MSLEPSANLFSPAGSGRSLPSPRATRTTAEEYLYKKDKNFRRYAAGVERSLALWDSAQQEWADYISFLARLLKALQAHPPDTTLIPHSDQVALRLAQCLNPTLPSGVHQKALDVYGFIFATIGKDALARDLNLYFPGLASVLSFASLSVRPLFLDLLENHILALDGTALRPALKAVVLSLLPGLEDETSEDFERMVTAIDHLRQAVMTHSDEIAEPRNETGASHFWQCFFLATITNASRRQGALAYLTRRLPSFRLSHGGSSLSPDVAGIIASLPPDAEAAVSPEPGLLIRCFESGLIDPQLLIQRGFLDLLVSHLPLDTPVLQQRISKDDLERLVAAATSVVSRRDMSLNRRLWAWLLGPEPTAFDGNDSLVSPAADKNSGIGIDPSSYHAAYFSQHGLQALTRSVMKMINRPSQVPADRARPFRVCLSLMDRWEVGGLIVPEIFIPALQSIQTYSEVATRSQLDDVMKSASAFFDGVDSGLIWGKLVHLVTSSLDVKSADREEQLQHMKLAKFILARFNLKEEEMVLHHMPLMILSVLSTLNDTLNKAAGDVTYDIEIAEFAHEITNTLIQLVPDRALQMDRNASENFANTVFLPRETVLGKIKDFYDESQGSLDIVDPPFPSFALGQLALREARVMFVTFLQSEKANLHPEMPARILSNLIVKVQHLKVLDGDSLCSVFMQVLSTGPLLPRQLLPFPKLSAMTAVLITLQSSPPSSRYISIPRLSEIVHPLVASLWQHLSPLLPKYHVEAVRCILSLHTLAPAERMIEAAISSIIARAKSEKYTFISSKVADNARRFAVMWTHTMHELNLQSEKRGSLTRRSSSMMYPISTADDGFQSVLTRPLLLLLDSLVDEGSETSSFVRNWISELPSLNRVFELIGTRLESLNCLALSNSLTVGATVQPARPQNPAEDTKECLYYLKHILIILEQSSHYTWVTLAEALGPSAEQSPSIIFFQEWLIRTCVKTLSFALEAPASFNSKDSHMEELSRTSALIISRVYQNPFATSLRDLELEVPLMARLKTAGPSLQTLLLDATLSALKLRLVRAPEEPSQELKAPSQSAHRARLSLTVSRDSIDVEPPPIPPPPQLVDCLKHGFSSPSSRLVLDDWVRFLVEVLPLFANTMLQNLLPLVECFCEQINATFQQLKHTFNTYGAEAGSSPEPTLISLINGLEQILARAHDRLMIQETKIPANKSPEQPQGFFGNMVSGVFTSETAHTRIPTANNRLTVLLCFQDTVRICFAIWTWGGYGPKDEKQDLTSASSLGYTSLRMRNRARRILEHLFAAEALECLETLAVLWAHAGKEDLQTTAIMGLLNVLNGSKPKHTIPAIFNAVYSRTNPNALEPNKLSTLTSNLADTDLVAFLVDYTKSLEDDAMDEIWQDCTLFLRDVLANPLPHRQILPTLLEFTAVIGQKVDNTNFGEQRKMRKELADIFMRILTAIFTTRSMSYLQDPNQVATTETAPVATNGARGQKRAHDVVSILNTIVPYLSTILVDNDRITKAVSDIASSVIGPIFRAKAFPDNVTKNTLELLYGLAKVAQSNKFWKKEIYDAFNDARFFNTSLPLLKISWLPILAQWISNDKDRLLELLTRLSAPTTAGIMFGVGADSARKEADRKTQLTLRRIALLILSSPEDLFTPNLPQIMEKLAEILTATPASSPSSITRAEALVLLRALILKTSSIHLAPLWPKINAELTSALSSLLPDANNKEHYNNAGVVQACKLLDELVVLNPDDFQLMQWLYISDTIDAVYKPSTPPSQLSLTDEISEALSQTETSPTGFPLPQPTSGSDEEGMRRLFLEPMILAMEDDVHARVSDMQREELVLRVVQPFLGNLSLVAFESTYSGEKANVSAIWDSIVGDAKGLD